MENVSTTGKNGHGNGSLQVMVPLAAVFVELRTLVTRAGEMALGALLEHDRTELCGPRYEHNEGRAAGRAGSTHGEVVLGGRKITVKRPRVRSKDGREIPLPTWERFAKEDPLTDRAAEQMIMGVSTRGYERTLEPIDVALKEHSTSRSSVSRRFIEATEKQLADLLAHDRWDITPLPGPACRSW